jgi:hypothetical protein
MTLIAAGSDSTSGLTAFARKKNFRAEPKTSNKRNWRRAK